MSLLDRIANYFKEWDGIDETAPKMELSINDLRYIANMNVERHRLIKKLNEANLKNEPKKMCIPPCNICYREECDCQCEHLGDLYRDAYRCPSCKSEKVYMSEYDLKYNYCPDCGQKLDWS